MDRTLTIKYSQLASDNAQVQKILTSVGQKEDLTLIYARLSKEDKNLGDSYSILNQRLLLENFAKENGLRNVVFLFDDDFTGSNFSRPAFSAAIELVKQGRVKNFVVKDLSRFGRDRIITGIFREMLFPEKDVRFIAINDNVDTGTSEGEQMAPLKELFNEWYASDTSKKIKAVKHARGNAGQPIGGTLPYGYMKSPNYQEDKKWLVDEEAAVIVRRIFQEYKAGASMRMIREGLVRDKILIPSKHKETKGFDSRRVSASPYWWSVDVVGNILANEAYVGTLINFKTYVKNYKTKKCYPNPRENWKIFPNHHAAIIDQETFDLVQTMRKREKRQHTVSGKIGLFTNLVFCADCGHKHYFSGIKELYFCSGYNSRHNKVCDNSHIIKESEIETILICDLKKLFELASQHEEELVQALREKAEIEQSQALGLDKKQFAKIQKRLAELSRLFAKLYEDNVSGKLSDSQFSELSTRFSEEQAELTQKSEELSAQLEAQASKTKDIAAFLKIVKHYTKPTKLSAEMVRELVERIEIGRSQGRGEKRVQEVKIIYRFIGELI